MTPVIFRNELFQVFTAELLGTWILVTFVNLGGGLATVLSKQGLASSVPSIALANGLGVMVGASVSYKLSGAHLNPAVSVAMFSLRQLSALKLLLYQLAQYLGGFLGGLTAYLLYHQLLDGLDGGQRAVTGVNATAGMLITMPNANITNGLALADQIINTALLLLAIRAVTDPRNMAAAGAMQPLLIGLAVAGIITADVVISSTCLNPARDFGPRVAGFIVGYGFEIFSHNDFYFWVPLLGPYAGALLGAWLYELIIAAPLQGRADTEAEGLAEGSVQIGTFHRAGSVEALPM